MQSVPPLKAVLYSVFLVSTILLSVILKNNTAKRILLNGMMPSVLLKVILFGVFVVSGILLNVNLLNVVQLKVILQMSLWCVILLRFVLRNVFVVSAILLSVYLQNAILLIDILFRGVLLHIMFFLSGIL